MVPCKEKRVHNKDLWNEKNILRNISKWDDS